MEWSYWADLEAGATGAVHLLWSGDPETWTTIRQSLFISITASLLSVLVGIPLGGWIGTARSSWRGIFQTFANAGFGLPPVVVGLVLSILLLRHGPLGALNLRFTPSGVILAQFILCVPIVSSLTAAAIQGLNPQLILQLRALGASRWQTIRLLLREAPGQLLVAYMAALGAVISEVGASMMVGGNLLGSTRTMTTAIVMETSMGHYDRAIAYSLILLLLVAVAMGLLSWLQHRETHP